MIYGINPVKSRLLRGQGLKRLIVKPGRRNQRLEELATLAEAKGCPVETAPLTEPVAHQGVALIADPMPPLDEKELLQLVEASTTPLLLALDGITDPGNLGACLRSAAALGVDAAILPKDKTAPLNQVTAKAASGALDLLPIAQATNLARTIRSLKAAGVWFIGTATDATTPLPTLDLAGPICIVMGAEGKGLRHKTAQLCDYLAAIPTTNPNLPLNVSAATAIALYEAQSQRKP